MSAIDIYDFRNLFASARSLAIIGNSPTILNADNGVLIDSHDLVVRFNQARTDGLESKVGSRTDVLVVNESNSLRKSPAPAEVLAPQCVVCFTRPTTDINITSLREWVGALPLLITLAPDIIGFAAGWRSRPLTQGTYALYVLLRLFPIERLLVTGFTMYGAVPGGASNVYAPHRTQAGAWHDLDEEAKIFADILAAFPGQLQATEEVMALLQRAGHSGMGTEKMVGSSCNKLAIYDYVLSRLAWRLMNWGIRLRRYLEANSRIPFDSLNK